MARQVIVGSQIFQTKTQAKAFFRLIRDAYSDGQRVSAEDAHFLSELIAIHPDAREKRGCGISHFTVQTETRYGKT